MAWINQERKKALANHLATVVPKDWKFTLSIQNNSTLVMTIRSAPVDLVAEARAVNSALEMTEGRYHLSLNQHHLFNYFEGERLKQFEKIVEAMNVGNHDNSDIQSDYFDVGWYVSINIGKWDEPFLHILPRPEKGFSKFTPKPKKKSFPDWQLSPYLPHDFAQLSPGRKAAATKKAMLLASGIQP